MRKSKVKKIKSKKGKKLTLEHQAAKACKLLVEWRNEVRFSQQKAADLIGISVRTLQNWEQLRRKPRGLCIKTIESFIAGHRQR